MVVVSLRAGWPNLQAFTDPRAFCYPAIDMSTNLDQLTADAMKLPVRDRVQLAQRLVSTIDDEVESDTEALWFAEAERRLDELRSGKVQGIPAEDVFRNAGKALKR
jgi:putative addiction module component (TIGR02574 family)